MHGVPLARRLSGRGTAGVHFERGKTTNYAERPERGSHISSVDS